MKIEHSNIVESNKNFKLKKKFEIPTKFEIISEIDKRGDNLSIWNLIWWLVKSSPQVIKILYYLIKATKMKKDGKTTFLATVKVVLGMVTMALALFNIGIPAGIEDAIMGLAGSGYLIFSYLQGLWTKDKDE